MKSHVSIVATKESLAVCGEEQDVVATIDTVQGHNSPMARFWIEQSVSKETVSSCTNSVVSTP